MNDKKYIILIQIYTPDGDKAYRHDKPEFVLGRAGNSDIKVNDVAISREHFKAKIENGALYIKDLSSRNGTYIDGQRIKPNEYVKIQDNSSITFGISQSRAALSLQVDNEVVKKSVEKSTFPKEREEFELNFKNVGLPIPKVSNTAEQAKNQVKLMIEEANFQKKSILKSAEVQKLNMINEAKLISKKAHDDALAEFENMVSQLLSQTKSDLERLRISTESELDDKRIKVNEEIQKLWSEHEKQIAEDKCNRILAIEKENEVKFNLEIEKAKADIFVERNKLLEEARRDIENQKNDFSSQIAEYEDKIKELEKQIAEYKKSYTEAKDKKVLAEAELYQLSQGLTENQRKYDSLIKEINVNQEAKQALQSKIDELKSNENSLAANVKKLESERDDLKFSIASLAEKKQNLETEIETLTLNLKDAKIRAKSEIDTEYANLRASEDLKFSEYKANELKEMQKIRDSHAESIKNMSIELSQEIASKLELLASKNGYSQFDFDKHFEIINSAIHIKNTSGSDAEASDNQNLENWKRRKRKQGMSLLATGFASALVIVYLANFVYERLKIDPAKIEMARLAIENEKAKEINRYIPEKSDQYYDNYVESVLYTENFTDTYLDENLQKEWVNYATKYFLKQWRVDEEKVIKVISNSKALVQNMVEQIPNMKKSRLKSDLAKMKEVEDSYIEQQSALLGTSVRYEAYKKIEKEFFGTRIKNRAPAGNQNHIEK